MLHTNIELELAERKAWAHRRQLGIPNNRRLWVLACMDERLPVEQALGIREGDAHIFRNAGGLVTDDAVRSAMLTTQFFGTKEIIIVNHTECGMMSATGEQLTSLLKERGIDPDRTSVDPSLPEFKLEHGSFARWIRTFTNVDDASIRQVEFLRASPLIPKDVAIHSYVWEVENRRLRRPHERLSDRTNTAEELKSGRR